MYFVVSYFLFLFLFCIMFSFVSYTSSTIDPRDDVIDFRHVVASSDLLCVSAAPLLDRSERHPREAAELLATSCHASARYRDNFWSITNPRLDLGPSYPILLISLQYATFVTE